jgi:A/G-specific adenine glycosylase
MHRSDRIRHFVDALWGWYSTNKRLLPWRDLPDVDPNLRAYKILVSEVMLQQTQVRRVVIAFRLFLERFPTLNDLASASSRDVLIAWRGMGYNSRALRLRDAARQIVDAFPQSMEELVAIPGIGHYTAAAIRNFAFGIPTPCIDTNIRRIFHRTFVGPENPDGTWQKDDRYLLKLAAEALEIAVSSSPLGPSFTGGREEKGGGGRATAEWHAALMDYGSLVQTKRNPRWDLCVLTKKKLMKTDARDWPTKNENKIPLQRRKEPGRLVGSTFVPNRIFRGRVIDELRDAPEGLSLETLGRNVCLDWSPRRHRAWLRKLVLRLIEEKMVARSGSRYALAS